MARDQHLEAAISDDVLIITIGVSNLVTAVLAGPHLDGDDPVAVDVDIFAAEILAELLREEEDGTTPIHRMLDAAAVEAIEQGAEGIRFGEGKD